MTYASLNGLENYLGPTLYAKWRENVPDEAHFLARIETRLLGVILPNSPSDEQIEPFCAAVYAQAEQEGAAAALSELPERVKSVTLGSYSVTLNESARDFPLCAEAKSLLLSAGLLYRGVPC